MQGFKRDLEGRDNEGSYRLVIIAVGERYAPDKL